jgi:membrane-associated phospholipid phosphatase
MDLLESWRSGRAILWGALLLQFACLIVTYAIVGMSIDPLSVCLIGLPILVSASIAFLYRNRIDVPKLAIGAEATAILMAALSLGTLLTYSAGTSHFPYADTNLRAVGLAIGFDWLAYADAINDHAWLCRILSRAYDSFNLQFVLILAVLITAGKIKRLRIFLLAVFIALTLTCILFMFLPAVSAYGHFGAAARHLTNLYGGESDVHVLILERHIAILEGLRDGSVRQVSAQTLTGLITFPSFHACAACLFMWGFWGVRDTRIAALILNLAMLAATPLFGAHYFVDLIGGATIAVVAIVASQRVFAHNAARRSLLQEDEAMFEPGEAVRA